MHIHGVVAGLVVHLSAVLSYNVYISYLYDDVRCISPYCFRYVLQRLCRMRFSPRSALFPAFSLVCALAYDTVWEIPAC